MSEKSDSQWAVEAVMALPCLPHVDFAEMKAYYTDPAFSLNNLGEGLYGWMKKKERSVEDGSFLIEAPEGNRWFLSCFVHLPAGPLSGQPAGSPRSGKLRIIGGGDKKVEIYLNGAYVPEPQQQLTLQGGMNRLIAIVHGGSEPLCLGFVFLNPDGTYMKDLQYRLTVDEVDPK
ncbi:hypothetical protein D3C71_1644780 [compost metagenome]